MTQPVSSCVTLSGPPRTGREGSVLFMTLSILFLLMALGSLAFVRATVDLREAGFYAQDAQALYHAEAGVNYCFARITNDFANGTIYLEAQTESVTYDPPPGFLFDPVTSLHRLADGKSYRFEVVGRAGQAMHSIEVIIRRDPGRPYTLQSAGPILLLNGSSGAGHIRSNDRIELDGPVTGNATPGPGHFVLNPAFASGSTASAPSVFTLDPIDPTELTTAATTNNNSSATPHFSGGNYTVIGGSATLQPGTYFFDNVLIDSGATVHIPDGTATVYVTGELHVLNNSLLNTSGEPDRLSIVSTSTGNMSVDSNSFLFGHVYAPDLSNFWVKNTSQLHGSLQIGGLLKLDDGSVYGSGGADPKPPSVKLSWQRQRL